MQTLREEESNNRGIRPPLYRLPAETRIGRVRIAVSDLQKSLDFYTRVIGLRVLSEEKTGSLALVRLGAQSGGAVLLELEALPAISRATPQRKLGLYHAAFLLPSRTALSSFVQHLVANGVPFGASNHLYSEALYLTDPDGFTVEVYADRPREVWTFEAGELLTGVLPLDVSALPQVNSGSWMGIPPGTTMGHVHFFVKDLTIARAFYHDGMGLDLMTWRYPGALFTSAGGYHHHVALNTWAAGSPLPNDVDPRLLFWELIVPHMDEVKAVTSSLERQGYPQLAAEGTTPTVTDPCGIKVRFVTRA